MLKSRRGLLAAGITAAVVGSIGVVSTLNAGAEQIPDAPAPAVAPADPAPATATEAAEAGPEFTPIELLLAAIGGCTALDVEAITGKRADPTDFLWKASHAEVKAWALDRIEAKYEVVAVVEDNPHVCAMVQQRGLVAIQLFHPGVNCLNPKGNLKALP